MNKVLVTLAAMWLGVSAQAAGFLCSKATTPVEKLVCADAQLSLLDSQLSVSYEAAASAASRRQDLKSAQLQWLSVRNSCRDVSCLKQTYLSRLRELQPSLDQDVLLEFLVQSIYVGDHERTKDLIEAGVDVNHPYQDGAQIRGTQPMTPLHFAAVNENLAAIELRHWTPPRTTERSKRWKL